MDPDSCYQVIFFSILLVFVSFFSAAESSLLSLNRTRLRQLVSDLNPKAVLADKLLQEPNKLFDTIFIGNNLSIVTAVVIGTLLLIDYRSDVWGIILAVSVQTAIVLIFGRLVPRIITERDPDKMSLKIIHPLYVILIILYPAVKLVNCISVLLGKVFGVEVPGRHRGITEEEIIDLVTAGEEDGIILEEESSMIHGVIEFDDTLVRDVMVPRLDIVAVKKDISYDDLIQVYKKEQFSRIPVYEETIDNILGVVHYKDLFFNQFDNIDAFNIGDYIRQTFFVPETKKVNELFAAMKREKIHIAIVLDEYGSTAGIVTIEDLIEEIMGDIQDEHDMEEPELQQIDANTVCVNASLRIDELNERLGLGLECEEAETVGGLVFSHLDRVPNEGDIVFLDDIEMTVQEMDGHRIEKLSLKRITLEANFAS